MRKGRKMACSAIYFLDMKGKVLLHRNYRGDIDGTVIDKFIGKIDNITEMSYSVSFRFGH